MENQEGIVGLYSSNNSYYISNKMKQSIYILSIYCHPNGRKPQEEKESKKKKNHDHRIPNIK